MLLAGDFYRIEGGLDRRANRPLFNVGAGNLVTLAEFVDQAGRICIRIVGLKEIIFAGENIIDPGPAGLDDERRGDAAARVHAAEKEGFLDVLRIAIPGAEDSRLLRGVAPHTTHFLGIQAGRTCSGSGGTKERRNAVRAPVALRLKFLSPERHGDASST